MTRYERRRFEMFTKVQEFGKVHKERFPDGSPGARALAALDATVAEIARLDAAKILAAREGVGQKARARTALAAQLLAVARTAKVLARERPGIGDTFAMPRRRSDVSLLSAARAFISQADALKEAFTQHGLELAVFQQATEAFEHAIRGRQAGRNDGTGAQAGIVAALAEGLAAVRTLDVVIGNTLGDEPLLTARWQQARRIVRGPAAASTAEPAPLEAGPGAAAPQPGAAPAQPAGAPAADAPAVDDLRRAS